MSARHHELQRIALETAQMKRKSSYPSKQPKKKQKIAKTDHMQIVSLKRDVRNLKLANETHVFDAVFQAALSAAPITAAYPSVILPIACPIQGDTINSRQGSSIKAKGFKIKVQIASNSQELIYTPYRIIVFCDRQNNSVDSPLILGNTNALLKNTLTTDVATMPRLELNMKRYTVMKDVIGVFTPQVIADVVSGGTTSVISVDHQYEWWIPFTKLIEFNNGNAGTNADVVTNACRIVVMQGAPVNGGAYCFASIQSRFYFDES